VVVARLATTADLIVVEVVTAALIVIVVVTTALVDVVSLHRSCCHCIAAAAFVVIVVAAALVVSWSKTRGWKRTFLFVAYWSSFSFPVSKIRLPAVRVPVQSLATVKKGILIAARSIRAGS